MKHKPNSLFQTVLFPLILFSFIRSEGIPPDRRIQWSPGIPGGFPEPMSSVNVYDLRGRRIQTVLAGVQEAGEHRAAIGSTFRSGELTSGVYLLILEAGGAAMKTKFTVVK
jgi:hypothetical protein